MGLRGDCTDAAWTSAHLERHGAQGGWGTQCTDGGTQPLSQHGCVEHPSAVPPRSAALREWKWQLPGARGA